MTTNRENRDDFQCVPYFFFVFRFFIYLFFCEKEAQVLYEVQYLVGIIVCIYEVPAEKGLIM